MSLMLYVPQVDGSGLGSLISVLAPIILIAPLIVVIAFARSGISEKFASVRNYFYASSDTSADDGATEGEEDSGEDPSAEGSPPAKEARREIDDFDLRVFRARMNKDDS